MRKVIENTRKHLGVRVKTVREVLGLTHAEVAQGSGVSERTVSTIEKGKSNYSLESLLSVVYFLGLELEEIANPNIEITDQKQLQEKGITFHKRHNLKPLLPVAKRRVSIKNVIKEKLLKTDFLNTPRETTEIVQFCRSEYNVKLKGQSVANTLKELSKEKLIKIIKSGETKGFLYKKTPRK